MDDADSLRASHEKALRLVRILELLKLRPWTAQQLATALGVKKRAVLYYLEDLKELEPHLGFRLLHDEIRHTYTLNAGVMLSDIDKVVAHTALRMLYHHSPGHNQQYLEAMLKLARGLPEPARTIAQRSAEAMAARGPGLEGSNLEKITNAWFRRQLIQFHYQLPGRREPTKFELETYFIEVSRANMAVYVIGRERSYRGELRTFKLARMQFVTLVGPTEAYEIPESFDPREYLSDAWGIVGGGGNPVRVRLRFLPQAVQRIREGGYPNLKELEECDDGSLVVEVAVGADEDGFPIELLSWVQSWGPRVEVLEPDFFRQRWLEEARAVMERYGPGGGNDSPERRYWAHTPRKDDPAQRWHSLQEHLQTVAQMAKDHATPFGAGDLAFVLGLLHDLGKFNPEFQRYLKSQYYGQNHPSVPHAIWGAALAYALLYRPKQDQESWKLLALPILGHHAGLEDAGVAASDLHDFLQKSKEPLEAALANFKALGLTIPSVKLPSLDLQHPTQRELFIRMVFSALVDADYIDTERHFEPERAELRGGGPSLQDLWAKLEAAQQAILDESTPVNRVRKEVYEACLEAASGPTGLYRLTVPTGGGKTRSSLAFALRHALQHGLQRVVVAIPYTSIIDQTAQAYREILGEEAVLEHHSALELPGDRSDRQDERFLRQRLASENWDAPLVVTTTVQLFESLFSNRPSKTRKLHRLVRSVIVLDEVQTLPPELLKPTLDVLRLLATPVERGGYGSTVVLCTATQPTFEESRWLEAFHTAEACEIVPQYPEHFAQLRRVRYEKRSEPLAWPALAEEVKGLPQAMVVLNTRKDALALLEALGNDPDAFHLSTLLCGAHRKGVLAEVRRRLREGCPVRLISTQVVEAGVDLDFPVVYRAVGPLDRIVQAAGRCNREGRLESGRVIIFEPAEGKAPSGPYKVGLEKARFLLREHPAERLHDPELYREYFRRLFADVDPDKKKIQTRREELNYPEVASRYRLIEGDTVSVVVPYEHALECLEAWQAFPARHTWQRLQPYLVSLYRNEVRGRRDWLEQMGENLYLWRGTYDDKLGLREGYDDPSDLVL
jgi:CRISPR-associated endonuclease/helicase Cas3